MSEALVNVGGKAVAKTANRQRAVTLTVLVALGLLLLFKYLRGGDKAAAGKGDAPATARGESARAAAPDAHEASLTERDASAVHAAAAKYDQTYQDRMKEMVAPGRDEGAPPFIGFSLADNIRPGALVVDGVFEAGPAFAVGVDIDHELVSIAGEPATDVETVRRLVAAHCRPGHVTRFTFYDDDNKRQYESEVWVMTADERFRGKPYFFAPQEHTARQSDRLKQTWLPGQTPKKEAARRKRS